MVRSLKIFGFALFAIFAMSALTTLSASAADLFTVGGAEKAWVTGTGETQQFNFTQSFLIECTTTKVTGTVVNGTSEMTVLTSHTGKLNTTPHNTQCDSKLGGFGVTFDMNGCHDLLTGSTTAKDGSQTDATVSIQCPTGKEIVITTDFLCTIKIQAQTPTEGGVSYQNLPEHAGGSAIRITTTMTGLTYHSEGAFCGTGEADNLDSTSTITVTGYEDKGGTLTEPIEGAQVPIQVS
jgi:hypothetical protein